MRCVLTTGLVAGAMILAPTGVATADESEFISMMQEEYPYVFAQHGADALVAQGFQACAMDAAGTGARQASDTIQANLPMSWAAANYIVMIAGPTLGC